VNSGRFFCVLSGWLFENNLICVGFKWNNDHTQLALDFVEDGNCAWETKPEYCRNKTACKGALLEMVQGLNFPGLSKEDRKLKYNTRQ
jgi:hypothetical protein